MPIVKQIIEQHGGDVHVQSSQGAGTRVVMRIPARAAAAGAS
jgi:signal transduction histidine kinase